MGLADLKKNASLCKTERPIAISIDDFIAAADLYAAGKSRQATGLAVDLCHNDLTQPNKVIDFLQRKYPQTLPSQASATENSHKPFRRCTYTLSETAIEQLTLLSQQGNVAKSKLIRQLICHYFNLSPEQQKQIELNAN
jgi:hypothetical protein